MRNNGGEGSGREEGGIGKEPPTNYPAKKERTRRRERKGKGDGSGVEHRDAETERERPVVALKICTLLDGKAVSVSG